MIAPTMVGYTSSVYRGDLMVIIGSLPRRCINGDRDATLILRPCLTGLSVILERF